MVSQMYESYYTLFDLNDEEKKGYSKMSGCVFTRAMIAGIRHRLVHDYDGTNWNIIVNVVFIFSSCLIESDADRIRQKFLGS